MVKEMDLEEIFDKMREKFYEIYSDQYEECAGGFEESIQKYWVGFFNPFTDDNLVALLDSENHFSVLPSSIAFIK